jgi:hypothetical protein
MYLGKMNEFLRIVAELLEKLKYSLEFEFGFAV